MATDEKGIVSAEDVTVPPWVIFSWNMAFNVALKGIPEGFMLPFWVLPATCYQVLPTGQLRLFAALPSGETVDMLVHPDVWRYSATKQ